jgi:hypothetical protein
MKIHFFIVLICILGIGGFLIYNKYFIFTREDENEVLKELYQKSDIIRKSAERLNISPRLLASVIYTEKRMNVTLVDAFEVLYADLGANSSIGLAQIRLTTGKWIIDNAKDSTSNYFIAKRYHRWLPGYRNQADLIRLLKQDSTNCLLAAFHIKQMVQRWQKGGYDISYRPDIIATLYTYGLTNRETGKEIAPHANPKSNFLGRVAKIFYESSKLQDKFPL